MIDVNNLFCLDYETHPTAIGNADCHALEPFRYKSKQAVIGSAAMCTKDKSRQITDSEEDITPEQLKHFMHPLFNNYCIAHNAVFDAAWAIVYIGYHNVKTIKWLDTMLLAKWVENSQAREFATKDEKEGTGLDLASLVKRYIPDYPGVEEFLAMKGNDEALTNRDYWDRRGIQDVKMTFALFEKLWEILPEEQRKGYLIECECIAPVANSWMVGLQFDREKAHSLIPRITDAKKNLLSSLGFSDEKRITSSTQLGTYLFQTLGLKPQGLTGTGKPSASAENLKFIHYDLTQRGDTTNADILKRILDFKQLATLESKYLAGFDRVYEHVGWATNYAAPRIFGTYTGRFTYTSKTKRKFQCGIATHQLPRKGPVKKLLTAPEGFVVAELDASGQESRLMALRSQDPNMLEVFRNLKDLHSMTGARVAGRQYDEFMELFHSGDKEMNTMRYCGKFINLSCNYRIGDKALAKKAFTNYGLVIDQMTAAQWNNLFKHTYAGVPGYWKSVVREAQIKGYTETFGKRRFYLSDWATHKWGTESSAINMPIQGAGADMKTLAISTIAKKFPEAIFILDLHDANFFYLPEENAAELLLEMRTCLNELDYESAWDYKPAIPLLWDAGFGPSFGEQKEVDWKSLYGVK